MCRFLVGFIKLSPLLNRPLGRTFIQGADHLIIETRGMAEFSLGNGTEAAALTVGQPLGMARRQTGGDPIYRDTNN